MHFFTFDLANTGNVHVVIDVLLTLLGQSMLEGSAASSNCLNSTTASPSWQQKGVPKLLVRWFWSMSHVTPLLTKTPPSKSCSSISHDDNRNIPPPPSHLFNHTQTSWNERILFLLSVRVCVYVHSIMVKHNLQTIKSSLLSTVNTATKLPMVKVQQTSWRLRLTIRDKSNLFHN